MAAEAGNGQALLNALEWRPIGPYRGGRVVAVAGHPTQPLTFYFGSTGGGVWKTTDGGTFWHNISDGYFKRASVGAIAVSEADPNVIYVGMGETTIRGNVSHGDGVYRSVDGGKTWSHCGLAETRNIAKVRIHPQNPDLVYVAALGHAHGPNRERGLYRSKDGGRSWEQVLFVSEDAGGIDLQLDPHNPRVLYCAFWEARRGPHYLNSGGPGSGLWKSTDGGDTWTDISRNRGLPAARDVEAGREMRPYGKIGIACSPAREGRIWAIVEHEDGAVFRSDDGGESWQRLCEDRNLRQRAWYYHHIYADPQDPETVWVLNVECWRSSDGGKTFDQVPVPHGDNHDLWIDPKDPQRMINGNDGGACVSFNGGESWSSIYNQPTAEFYHVTVDNSVPYRVLGAQQDNTTIATLSRSPLAAINNNFTFAVGGGESGYIAVKPNDPDIIYAGSYQGLLTRYNHRTGQQRNIMPWPEFSMGAGPAELKYRFQWTYPIVISPHDPNTLYVTGNRVLRSRDEGVTWEEISPDLTRDDKSKQQASGGPITRDNTGAEYYCTIFAFAESPEQAGLFWAGSDDGLVHVSRDGGGSWQNVTPPDLPEWALISIIEPSPHDPAVAYVAATRYKLDDFRPYLYKTSDYGQTWTRIVDGIPEDDFTRVIREDPARRGLLYAGTETGLYVSFDDGGRWERVNQPAPGSARQRQDLPVVPIHDLVVKDNDLVVATHGRSFWILDDLSPLRQLSDEVRAAEAHLFAPVPTIRYLTARGFGHPPNPGKNYRMTGATMMTYRIEERENGEKREVYLDAGHNPPDGVIVSYFLREQPAGEVTLAFLDADGNLIKRFTSERPLEKRDEEAGTGTAAATAAPAEAARSVETELPGEGAEGIAEPETAAPEKEAPRVPKRAGINRFVWNMRYPDPKKLEGDESMRMQGGLVGPVAPPGTYTVRLTVNGKEYSQPFDIRRDPRIEASDADLQEQFTLLQQINAKLSETHEAINRLRATREQVNLWAKRAETDSALEAVGAGAKALAKRLSEIEEELVQVKAKSRQDTLNYPIKLNAKLAALFNVVASADAAPTSGARAVFDDLSARIDAQLKRLGEVLDADVAALNRQISEAALPAIAPPR